MMGGIAGSAYISSSTIFSKPEGMRDGPTLPFSGYESCALFINQTHTFLVGGFDKSYNYMDEAYIYDLIRATAPPPHGSDTQTIHRRMRVSYQS